MGEYLRDSRRWETAVLLTVPLFAIYEIGLLLFSDGSVRNAAEVMITRELLRLHGRVGGLIVNGLVLLLFAVAAWRGKGRLGPGLLVLVALEGLVWAQVLPLLARLVGWLGALSVPTKAQVSDISLRVGAGLYEELIFRLILVAGGYVLLHRACRVDRIWATVSVLILSSAAFSGFHHLGAFGEPWEVGVFTFRFLAGVFLGCLFISRGLAVTCWTHATSNVLLLLP